MKYQRAIVLTLLACVLALSTTSCRGVQIRDTESRVDKLEARVSALEAQVQMLAKK